MHGTMGQDEFLGPGEQLVSPSGEFIAELLIDGNFVVMRRGKPPHFKTNTSTGVKLIMQGDGNLVLYAADGKWVWESRTWGSGTSFVRMQDDGNLVVYKQGGATFDTGLPPK